MEDNALMIPVSFGELFDKISILKIKSIKFSDPVKLLNVNKEFEKLMSVASTRFDQAIIEQCILSMMEVNQTLWDIEEAIRKKEFNKQFDEEFISLARNVYFYNAERSEKKKLINKELGSLIVEEKDYSTGWK
jgi:hypothetical protein